jgi:hypothetical protein
MIRLGHENEIMGYTTGLNTIIIYRRRMYLRQRLDKNK